MTLLVVLAPSARAEEPAALDGTSLLAAVLEAEPSVLDDVAQVTPDTDEPRAIETATAGADIIVPSDPQDNIALEVLPGEVIELGLPFATEAERAENVTEGIVSYDNGNGSMTMPVVKDDGSVQVTTVIVDSSAPTSYPYRLSVPEGGSLQAVEGGGGSGP